MHTEPTIIHVDPSAVKAFNAASDEDRHRLEALLSLHLIEVATSQDTLADVMYEISLRAGECGLTPEILQAILVED